MTASRAVIQKGSERQLVYWFEGAAGSSPATSPRRFANIADSLRLGRTDGGLVRVITPIGEDGVAAADARPRASSRQRRPGSRASSRNEGADDRRPLVSILVVSYNTRGDDARLPRERDRRDHGALRADRPRQRLAGRLGAAIAAAFPDVRLIASAANLGFAKGNNVAAREAKAKYILLLNPDTLVLDRAVEDHSLRRADAGGGHLGQPHARR